MVIIRLKKEYLPRLKDDMDRNCIVIYSARVHIVFGGKHDSYDTETDVPLMPNATLFIPEMLPIHYKENRLLKEHGYKIKESGFIYSYDAMTNRHNCKDRPLNWKIGTENKNEPLYKSPGGEDNIKFHLCRGSEFKDGINYKVRFYCKISDGGDKCHFLVTPDPIIKVGKTGDGSSLGLVE